MSIDLAKAKKVAVKVFYEPRGGHPFGSVTVKEWLERGVEAAAPVIAAQAFRDEAKAHGYEWVEGKGYDYTAYGKRLLRRADELDPR